MRIVCAILLTATVAACGGPARLTRAEYVAKLDAMCNDFAARERAIGEPSTFADIAAHGTRIADAFDAAIRDPERRLRPPVALEPQSVQLQQLAAATSRNLHALATAARAGDRAQVMQLAAQNGVLNARSNRLATAIGACTGSPG